MEEEFLKESVLRMGENPGRIKKCLDELTEEQLWERANSSSNSIGNLILHLHGNISQYILSGLGGEPDKRQRDDEFNQIGAHSKEELLVLINGTIKKAQSIILDQNKNSLIQKRWVQGFQLSGIGIIIHVVEHLSYHTGQIAFWTKTLIDKDLGFYKDFDLNKKND